MKSSLLVYLILSSLTAIALNLATAVGAIAVETALLDFGLEPPPEAIALTPEPSPQSASTSLLTIPRGADEIPVGESDSRSVAELPPPPPIESTSESEAIAPLPEAFATERSEASAPANSDQPNLVQPDSEVVLHFEAAADPVVVAPVPDPEPVSEVTAESLIPAPVPAVEPEAPLERSPSPTPTPSTSAAASTRPVELTFDPFDPAILPTASQPEIVTSDTPISLQPMPELDALFQGGENSLVARAIGSAEGTRTPEGGRTPAYGGHTDPGNGVWNLGTFSYQHGARSPEEADAKQLQRLQSQAETLTRQAEERGLSLTLEEKLNALDLANQSPRAALSTGGYMDRLREAYDMGLRGTDAILWARTRSFLDPDTRQWNAPGLGNTVEGITADQERRMNAIARAITVSPPPVAIAPEVPPVEVPADSPPSILELNAERIIQFDL